MSLWLILLLQLVQATPPQEWDQNLVQLTPEAWSTQSMGRLDELLSALTTETDPSGFDDLGSTNVLDDNVVYPGGFPMELEEHPGELLEPFDGAEPSELQPEDIPQSPETLEEGQPSLLQKEGLAQVPQPLKETTPSPMLQGSPIQISAAEEAVRQLVQNEISVPRPPLQSTLPSITGRPADVMLTITLQPGGEVQSTLGQLQAPVQPAGISQGESPPSIPQEAPAQTPGPSVDLEPFPSNQEESAQYAEPSVEVEPLGQQVAPIPPAPGPSVGTESLPGHQVTPVQSARPSVEVTSPPTQLEQPTQDAEPSLEAEPSPGQQEQFAQPSESIGPAESPKGHPEEDTVQPPEHQEEIFVASAHHHWQQHMDLPSMPAKPACLQSTMQADTEDGLPIKHNAEAQPEAPAAPPEAFEEVESISSPEIPQEEEPSSEEIRLSPAQQEAPAPVSETEEVKSPPAESHEATVPPEGQSPTLLSVSVNPVETMTEAITFKPTGSCSSGLGEQ
ncbi:leucine-rich repeat-containing protein 37A-like [Ochotona curzoniae]|uniref:leucine-rich repeat-containing protein 37A-like n=1 Tax=Ochotona curzoniae TaxID=130825 RepID=UPI001B352A96|nr:leucine-rich repeat-containing protein 37A-like [Ochotona curzoniae]